MLGDLAQECAQPAGELDIRDSSRSAIQQRAHIGTDEGRASPGQRIALEVQFRATVFRHQRQADEFGLQEILVRELRVEKYSHPTTPKLAEGARFELAGDRGSPTRFKRAAIDHSATPPCSSL